MERVFAGAGPNARAAWAVLVVLEGGGTCRVPYMRVFRRVWFVGERRGEAYPVAFAKLCCCHAVLLTVVSSTVVGICVRTSFIYLLLLLLLILLRVGLMIPGRY